MRKNKNNTLKPGQPRKPDTQRNENDNELQAKMDSQTKREQKLYRLRITPTTVICVPKEKCTQEYAEQYKREKMGIKVWQ